MKLITRGRVGGLLGAGLGMFLVITSRNIPASKIAGDPGSGMLPLMAGLICLVSGLILLLKKPDETDLKPYMNLHEWRRALSVLSMYLAFFVGMYLVGYLVTTPVVIFATCSIMAQGKQVPVRRRILFALCVSAVIYVIFHMVLNVVLPKGLLGIG